MRWALLHGSMATLALAACGGGSQTSAPTEADISVKLRPAPPPPDGLFSPPPPAGAHAALRISLRDGLLHINELPLRNVEPIRDYWQWERWRGIGPKGPGEW